MGVVIFIIPILYFIVKREFIYALFMNAFIFVMSLMLYGSYDIPFVCYLVVNFTLILINIGKNIRFSRLSVIFLMYILLITFISIFLYNNNTIRALSVFLMCFVYPVFFILLINNIRKIEVNYNKFSLSVFLIVIFEFTLSIYLFITNDFRAVFNHHPIGGGISVAILPFIVFLIDQSSKNIKIKLFVFLSLILSFFSVLMSGTRGYMLIYGLVIIGVILKVFLYELRFIRLAIFLITSSALLVVVWLNQNIVIDFFLETTRINQSLGRRDLENSYVLQLFKHSNLLNQLFGYGLGARPMDVFPVYNFSYDGVPSDYAYAVTNRGIVFHNVWITGLYTLGIVGTLVYFVFFAGLFNKIRLFEMQSSSKLILSLFVVGIAVCFLFRETLFRGVFEMTSLALVLILYNNDD